MDRIEHFTIGEENFPNWFNNAMAKGRVKVSRDEYTGKLMGVTVSTVSGPVKGKIGDVAINTRNGVLIIPIEKAKQYFGGKV